MIKALLFDLSRTILFAKDKDYPGELNALHRKLSNEESYNFSDHFVLDNELLTYISSKKREYRIYMFTSGYIQDAPDIKPQLDEVFERIISAEDLGFSKKDPNAYKLVAGNIGLKPHEILFVDDSEENVKAATKAGVNTILYRNLDDLKKRLEDTPRD